jgi:putative flippase GtrA
MREISAFIFCGCAAVATDGLTYFALSSISFSHPVAKAISFITGSAVAYFANKTFTFKIKDDPAAAGSTAAWSRVSRFAGLYASTLGANVLVNQAALAILSGFLPVARAVSLAFLCATGTSTVLNYLGQKFWVFRPGSTSETRAAS